MEVFLDKSWVNLRRIDDDYKRALDSFLDFAMLSNAVDNKVACPCRVCGNRKYYEREVVRNHLIMKGMDKDYRNCIWNFHGESRVGSVDYDLDDAYYSEHDNSSGEGMIGMIEDVFHTNKPTTGSLGPNHEADTFFKLVEDAGQPLYPNCENFSKLSFIVEMYHLKCLYGITDVAFDSLLKLFKRALPNDSTLPDSYKKAQNTIRKLGLHYKKIDACENDCVLFWRENEKLDKCPNCNAVRWKMTDDGNVIELTNGKKVPKKVLRHFPLIPRLKRLYMSSKTAPFMRWHEEGRKDDGKLRHPADSFLWKDFNKKYPDFADEPRNVRLGLASDGFNPFGMMGTQYSVWPVVLMNYNLPPWLCMKQSYFMLSLLIPGPKAPGNDIDVYLQPLVEELKELWEVGVETYDVSTNKTFMLRAALNFTINDFPAYGNLSGWKTKGRHACPYCNVESCSLYLRGSKKMVYMGHRRFLDENHRLRRMKKAFNGKTDLRPPPRYWSGSDLVEQMEGLDIRFGKDEETKKHNKKVLGSGFMPWKKKSIFFKLPYWEHLVLRHNLDVMHVEKNVSENLLGTLLGIDGKTKDNLQSRLDLVDLNIRHNLHPIEDRGKQYLPPACFTLSAKEKDELLRLLASVKVPDGYAANIKKNIVEGKIYGLKSHDHHIIMQHLLPLAARKMKNKEVSTALIELSNYFKELCSKVSTEQDYQLLQQRSILLLCQLERIFNPSFFDIMVHLIIHLAHEAKLAGPVFYRWMYPVERYLRRLKAYVRNKSRVEGSIAEGYIAEEATIFCSRYLEGVVTMENRCTRNNDDDGGESHDGISVFSLKSRAMSTKKDLHPDSIMIERVHFYVLTNCDEVGTYADEHYSLIANQYRHIPGEVDDIHRRRFPTWFAQNVSRNLPQDLKKAADLRCLSQFPSMWVKTMTKVTCNGFRWRVKSIDKRSVTQNSGVCVKTATEDGEVYHFGVLTKIIELSYPEGNFVLMFDCEWVDPIKGVKKDDLGFTVVNLNTKLKSADTFVLASQAVQVFYTPEIRDKHWNVVTITKPRDLFDMEEDNIPIVDSLVVDLSSYIHDEEFDNSRDDIVGVSVDGMIEGEVDISHSG